MLHRLRTPESSRLAWLGTGVMGAAMCGHLLRAGYRIAVHTRTKAKAEPLLALGATWAETPAAAAANADAVFAIVGFPQDVRDVFLGPTGALAGAKPGTLFVDMTTSDPALAVEIAAAAQARGGEALDAPVSGGDVGARNATLSIMVGGSAAAVEAVQPCFAALGKLVVHHGLAGAGQHAKLANQIMVGALMVGICETLLYARTAGLDPLKALESIGSGAAASTALAVLGPRMLRRDFAPGFYIEHFVKDLGLAVGEAKRRGLALPGLALAEQLYLAAAAQGHGRDGTQALLLALENLSGLKDAR